jgi:hypothetical protein
MSSHLLHNKHTWAAVRCDAQLYYTGDNISFSLEFQALSDADGRYVQT